MLDSEDDCHDGGDWDDVGAEEKWDQKVIPDDDIPAFAVPLQLAEVGAACGFFDAPAAEVTIAEGEIAEGTQKTSALIAGMDGPPVRVKKAGGFLGLCEGLGCFTDGCRATPRGEEMNSKPGLTAGAFRQ